MQDKSVVPSTKLSSSSLPKASQLTPSALEAMHTPLLRNTLTTMYLFADPDSNSSISNNDSSSLKYMSINWQTRWKVWPRRDSVWLDWGKIEKIALETKEIREHWVEVPRARDGWDKMAKERCFLSGLCSCLTGRSISTTFASSTASYKTPKKWSIFWPQTSPTPNLSPFSRLSAPTLLLLPSVKPSQNAIQNSTSTIFWLLSSETNFSSDFTRAFSKDNWWSCWKRNGESKNSSIIFGGIFLRNIKDGCFYWVSFK